MGARMYAGYWDSVRGSGRRDREWRAAAILGLAQRVLVNTRTGRGAPGEALLVPVTPLAALPVYALAFRAIHAVEGPPLSRQAPVNATPGGTISPRGLPTRRGPSRPHRLPEPPGLPVLGHLWPWTNGPLRLLEDGARTGPVFRLRLWA